MAISTPWTTSLPSTQDTPGVEQPNLLNDSSPGAHDGNTVEVSHLHALRDKAEALAESLGTPDFLPLGSTKDLTSFIEPIRGYQETTPTASAFPTAIIWYTDSGKGTKVWEKLLTYSGVLVTTEIIKVYILGTLARTQTTSITYSGVFETHRTTVVS